ncbi:uncharacterized protein [Dermacentor albipictus]|uniref:uncharacterized protein n=1 Tax=Dermacentor albipictus TaxID=60249 RepID=UPI0038FC7C31
MEEHTQVLVFGFCGDNLSLNRLGGFSCCFSSGRVCRFCMVSAKHLADKTSDAVCQARTASRHQLHLQALAVNSIYNRRLYGVNEESPLLELAYFDVTRQLPPDVMHDILEGTTECVLRQVMKSLLSSGVLSKKDVEEISSFPFGPNDRKNKPVQVNMSFINNKATLRGTASSKWCVLRFIPLVLGPKVPEGNEDWELLLQFREVTDIIFAPEIPAERLAYLDVLVETFLTEFANRYGRQVITPKMHYMVHYARCVREMGPLKHLWSMRFKAKHQELKKQASCVKNFKNITLTLSKRHQLKQSFQMQFFQLYEGLATSQSKPVDYDRLPECAKGVLPVTTHEVKSAAVDKCNG